MAGYIGNYPTAVPLTGADLTDGIITSAKIADGAIVGDDVNSTFDLTGKTVTLPTGVGGKVLQVVQATDETARSTTSGTYVTASNTLSVSITPSSTSNKILILTNTSTYQSSADSTMNAAIFKNASQLKYISYNFQRTDNSNVINAIYLDSPATTSSITYDIRFSISTGTGYINASGSIGTIVAMEISA